MHARVPIARISVCAGPVARGRRPLPPQAFGSAAQSSPDSRLPSPSPNPGHGLASLDVDNAIGDPNGFSWYVYASRTLTARPPSSYRTLSVSGSAA